MGLFVDGRGHYQGWLAALLCCFVALNHDESPAERQREKTRQASGQEATCYGQPSMSLTALPTLLAKVNSEHNDNDFHDKLAHDGPPMKGSPGTAGPLKPPIKRTSSLPLPPSPVEADETRTRPPTRVPGSTLQRQGLVPLQLGPVVLRDLPDVESTVDAVPVSTASRQVNRHSRTESTTKLLDSAAWPYYDTEHVSKHEQPDTRQWNLHLSPPPYVHKSASAQELYKPTCDLSPADLFQPHQQHKSPTDTSSASHLPGSNPRPAARLKRKHSESRKSTIEQEVLELNTLVSSRRAQVSHPPFLHSHIPAARSETLETIGSAFSRPLTRHATQVPQLNTTHDVASPVRRPQSRHRVSGWLSHLHLSITSPPTPAPNPPDPPQPFYKCELQPASHPPRAQSRSTRSLSRASSGTLERENSVEGFESPTSSAPTTLSHGWHSRELNGERGEEKGDVGVGVAM